MQANTLSGFVSNTVCRSLARRRCLIALEMQQRKDDGSAACDDDMAKIIDKKISSKTVDFHDFVGAPSFVPLLKSRRERGKKE